jgi:hypothetical protein
LINEKQGIPLREVQQNKTQYGLKFRVFCLTNTIFVESIPITSPSDRIEDAPTEGPLRPTVILTPRNTLAIINMVGS